MREIIGEIFKLITNKAYPELHTARWGVNMLNPTDQINRRQFSTVDPLLKLSNNERLLVFFLKLRNLAKYQPETADFRNRKIERRDREQLTISIGLNELARRTKRHQRTVSRYLQRLVALKYISVVRAPDSFQISIGNYFETTNSEYRTAPALRQFGEKSAPVAAPKQSEIKQAVDAVAYSRPAPVNNQKCAGSIKDLTLELKSLSIKEYLSGLPDEGREREIRHLNRLLEQFGEERVDYAFRHIREHGIPPSGEPAYVPLRYLSVCFDSAERAALERENLLARRAAAETRERLQRLHIELARHFAETPAAEMIARYAQVYPNGETAPLREIYERNLGLFHGLDKSHDVVKQYVLALWHEDISKGDSK